jgi:excisionase family DNA binding protein
MDPQLLPYDLHNDPLTYEQAAELAGVAEGTIRTWVHRGKLPKTDTPDGPRVLGINVLRAEAATRARARRRPVRSAAA